MVRLSTLLYFYRKRLRVHAMQELLAALGIAAGVALVFAVQVANGSITASAREILHSITGAATLQVSARDTGGFDAATLARVRALPGVEHAAPLLEQRATLDFKGRRVAIDLIGADASLPSLKSATTRNLLFGGFVLTRGIVLPAAVGDALHMSNNATSPQVTIAVRGHAERFPVLGVLKAGAVGPVAGAMLGAVALPYAQRLSGLERRISRILVVSRPGQEALVRAGLEQVAGARLKVSPVDEETRILDQATGPIDQATGLFAGISALVGLLFTFNAMLLTVPERRRFIADLRIMGYRPWRLIQILAFQAVVLGALASALGLTVGYLLSHTVAHDPPSYLAFAFPVGVQPVVALQTVVLSFLGGIAATSLAAAQPLLDLRRSRAVNAVFKEQGEPGQSIDSAGRRRLALVAVTLVVAATALLLIAPALAVVGIGAVAIATVLVIPTMFAAVLRLCDAPARRWRLNALVVATRALRATSIRSLALAATGAVAVFGTISIEGAHRNLVSGLDRNFGDYLATADLWVTGGGDENSLTTQSFELGDSLTRARAVAGVARVSPYYGSLLDVGDRRIWIVARPTSDRSIVPVSQLRKGDPALANARLRHGGWVAVSESIARSQHAALGDPIVLPTPTGRQTFRLAATLTNLGWGPGAVVMTAPDYRRAWHTSAPSALEVRLTPGSDPSTVRGALQRALDPSGMALRVQTAAQRGAQFRSLARQGLQRLSQISALLLIAAVLAMAAAMGAGIWQRRAGFAQFRIMGWRPNKLWRALLFETGLILGTGCVTGALAGIYGHLLASRWMQSSTGFPAPFSLTPWQTIATSVLVAAAAVAVTAVPGYFVSRVPVRLGLNTKM
jgi:putative ABC transport system permease protein